MKFLDSLCTKLHKEAPMKTFTPCLSHSVKLVAFSIFLITSGWIQVSQAIQEVSRSEVGEWLEATKDLEPTFKPGDVLTADDLDKIKPFLPPGPIGEMAFSEFSMEISETGKYAPHPAYQQATLQFQGQASLAPDGALTNYIAGQPFSNPDIDNASAEQAGLMAAWNNAFRWQHYGQKVIFAHNLFLEERDNASSDFSIFPPEMISGGGHIERSVDLGWRRVYMSRLAQLANNDYRFDFRGAESSIYKELTEYFAPFEFRDQKLLAERWADPHENDTLNAYLPGERKVRRLSAKEKSDTWLGGEITYDDFYGFDGNVLSNTWTYLGQHRVLAVMNTKHQYIRHYGPHSRVLNDRWELRNALVVEGVPTLEGHPYGSRMMFFDSENYNFIIGLYFDPQGRLMRGSTPAYSWSEDTLDNPEENHGAHVSMYKGYAFMNFQTGRTSLTNVIQTSYPKAEAKEVRRLYRVDTLNQGR